jgi:hypothetical protein
MQNDVLRTQWRNSFQRVTDSGAEMFCLHADELEIYDLMFCIYEHVHILGRNAV